MPDPSSNPYDLLPRTRPLRIEHHVDLIGPMPVRHGADQPCVADDPHGSVAGQGRWRLAAQQRSGIGDQQIASGSGRELRRQRPFPTPLWRHQLQLDELRAGSPGEPEHLVELVEVENVEGPDRVPLMQLDSSSERSVDEPPSDKPACDSPIRLVGRWSRPGDDLYHSPGNQSRVRIDSVTLWPQEQLRGDERARIRWRGLIRQIPIQPHEVRIDFSRNRQR